MVNAETIVIVIVVLARPLSFGCCCHFMSGKRREEEIARRNTSPSTQQTAVDSSANTHGNASTVYVLHLQGASSNNSNTNPTGGEAIEHPEEDSQENAHDAIAESGPPPYSNLEDSNEPQLPPPSYEEALRLTIENLATPRE